MKLILKFLLAVVLGLFGYVFGFGFYLTTLDTGSNQLPERQMSEVWANYEFTSHYVSVIGSRMHYIDEGDPDGPVFLFLHGNPTSSYLWRNVIPSVAKSGARVIAVDHIGFGASDKPDIGYTFVEHTNYLSGFIEALGLEDFTLVVHDWGSALGFDYAYRHQDNVRAIIFMESITRIFALSDLAPGPQRMFKLIKNPAIGELMVLGHNLFVEKMMPMNIVRTLSPEERAAYSEPFSTFSSRIPTLVFPRQVPFDGQPEDVAARVKDYSKWLPESTLPKLLFYFDPGRLINKERAQEIDQEWNNTDIQFIGEGLHFVQEDNGKAIGKAIVEWQAEIFSGSP